MCSKMHPRRCAALRALTAARPTPRTGWGEFLLQGAPRLLLVPGFGANTPIRGPCFELEVGRRPAWRARVMEAGPGGTPHRCRGGTRAASPAAVSPGHLARGTEGLCPNWAVTCPATYYGREGERAAFQGEDSRSSLLGRAPVNHSQDGAGPQRLWGDTSNQRPRQWRARVGPSAAGPGEELVHFWKLRLKIAAPQGRFRGPGPP